MGSRDEKVDPDRVPRPHEIDESKRAADREEVEDVFVTPGDGLDRVDELGVEGGGEDVEKSTPEVVDDLDHVGLEDEGPVDHPGEGTEEPTKGVQARWGKAGP